MAHTSTTRRTTRTVAVCTLRVCAWVVIGVGRVIAYAWGFVRCHDLWALHDAAEAKRDVRACLKVRASIGEESGSRWKAAALIAFGLCLAAWGAVTRLPPTWLTIVAVVLVAALAVVGALPDPPDDDDVCGHVIDGEIVEGDLDTGHIVAPPWPLASGTVIDIEREPVPIGHAHGRVIAVQLDRHLLIGGITGSGKSELIKVILLACALDLTSTLHVWSFKSARDFAPLQPLCASFGGGRDAESIAAAVDVLAWLADEELPRRERDGFVGRIVLVLDETQILLSHHEHGAEARRCVGIITQVGRSAGVVVIIATQRPSRVSVPPEISDNLEIRIGLKVHNGPSNRLIFGESADSAGLRADLIDTPGVAWLDDNGTPTLITGWLLDPATITAVVSHIYATRPRAAIEASPPRLAVAPDPDPDPGPDPEWAAAMAHYAATLAVADPASDQQDATTGLCPACGAAPPAGRTYCGPACRKRASRRRRSQ